MEKTVKQAYDLLRQAEQQFADDSDVFCFDTKEALEIVKIAMCMKIVSLLEDIANG